MKKLFLIVSIGAVALTACNGGKLDKANEIIAQDSIEIESLSGQKDSLMNLLGEINGNLLEINQMENIVTSKDFSGETPERKKEILNNLESIKHELAIRRQKLDELEAKLKKSNGYTAGLKKTIESQKELIAGQSAKIQDLEGELAKANIKIEGLSTQVDSLNVAVETVSSEREAAIKKSEDLTNELNTCYYIIADNKSLKEAKVLEKKFLGKTKVMEGDYDRSAFIKADKRQLTKISTNSKEAKIVSKQPVNSYVIEDEGGVKVIRITNPTLFWEKSDFLVVEIK